MKTCLACLPVLLLAACANDLAAIRNSTVKAIGGGVDPNAVVLTDVDSSSQSLRWTATTQRGLYKCEGDSGLQQVNCYHP
ncbi:MAG TPA: hypothetical protein VHE37_03290 [Nevskiaceae bacterium]|nr:hypothetical protein [Nevskiaceae bacterium]